MMKSKSVLFVHHSNDLYGADIMLLETVKGLDREQFSPIVVLPDDCRGQGGLAAELEAVKVPYVFIPLGVIRRKYFRPRYLLRYCLELVNATKKLLGMVREHYVSLVHSNTMAVCAGAFAARLAGVRHVWHI